MNKAVYIALALLLVSCAGTAGPAADDYEQSLRDGNYSLIVVVPGDGGPPMGVLDLEGDPFVLAPEEGAREELRKGGLSKKEAVILADESLPGSGVMLKAVTGQGRSVIGYEVYPPPSHGTGPATTPGSEEAVLLPNLLRIDYSLSPTGRQRIRVISLPLSEPESAPRQ